MEANLYKNTDDYEKYIESYKLTESPTMESYGYSRLQLLVREGLNLKFHRDLRHCDIASIWVTVKLEGQKNLKVGGVYREHSLLEQENTEKKGWNRNRTGGGTSSSVSG